MSTLFTTGPSALFDNTVSISATNYIVMALYVKLPATLTGYGAINNFMQLAGTSHTGQVYVNSTPNFRGRADYGSGAIIGANPNLTLDTWIGLAVKISPYSETAGGIAVNGYVVGSAADNTAPDHTATGTGAGGVQTFTELKFGHDGTTQDIPGTKIAHGCIFVHSTDAGVNTPLDAFLAGDDPSTITTNRVEYYSFASTNEGLTESGTVTPDSGDNPSFGGGGGGGTGFAIFTL